MKKRWKPPSLTRRDTAELSAGIVIYIVLEVPSTALSVTPVSWNWITIVPGLVNASELEI